MLVNRNSEPPTSQHTWINMYPFLENQDWKPIYSLPFHITAEPYFQSFQYKIINRIINTREKLYDWKIIDSNKCLSCGLVDTIELHFVNCPTSKHIWDQLFSWINNNLEVRFPLTECEILFGITANNYTEIKIIY